MRLGSFVPKLYDEKCREVSETFLSDLPHLYTEARVDELAGLIQDCVESYIDAEQCNYEPPDHPGFEGGFAENR